MMLWYLLYLKIVIVINFQQMGWPLYTVGSLGFNCVWEKGIQIFCIFSIFVNISSLSTSVTFSEDFVLSEKKALIVFQDCYPQYLFRLKLVLTY